MYYNQTEGTTMGIFSKFFSTKEIKIIEKVFKRFVMRLRVTFASKYVKEVIKIVLIRKLPQQLPGVGCGAGK